MTRWWLSVANSMVTPNRVRKLPISTPCWPWVGSTEVTKPSPTCWAIMEPATCSADSLTRGGAEDDADHDLMQHQDEQRCHRGHVDMIGLPMQRQDDQREQQRDRELDAHGDVGFPEARQQ